MTNVRRHHDPAFKASVAQEAMAGRRTVTEIASEKGVHPAMVTSWKKEGLEALRQAFTDRKGRQTAKSERDVAELERTVRKLTIEINYLKKKLGLLPLADRRQMVDSGDPVLSVRAQCELLDVCRSTLYYKPGPRKKAEFDNGLKPLIEKTHKEHPFFGRRRIADWLNKRELKDKGFTVSDRQVRRLMREMGIKGA